MDRMNRTYFRARFVVSFFLTLVIVLFCAFSIFSYIQSLKMQIVALEQKTFELNEKVARYENGRCEVSSRHLLGGVQRYNMRSAGYERGYQVQTPRNYDPDLRYPVILSFDGMEGSGDRMRSYANLQDLPAIVVYPDSLEGREGFTAWQGAPYAINSDRDIQFVRDIIMDLPEKYCVDSLKQFAVGMSNGGGFANLVACELSDQIRAVASVSGAYYTDCAKNGKRTPSLMVVHSKTDKQVPFLGAINRNLPDVPQWIENKAVARSCQDKSQSTAADGTMYYSWFNCKNDSLLRLVAINDQEHGWLHILETENKDSNTAQSIWRFFQDSTYS